MRVCLLLLGLIVAALPASAQTEPVRIVILGSSNAAGTGPSVADSAWVNRLRAHLVAARPGSEVINRAKGGYLTYHLMPSDYTPPSGRQQPDPGRNITRAVSDEPDAIVISLTSNDADLGYTPVEQLDRYEAMIDAADRIPVFITTTTPRSFWRDNGAGTKASKRKIQAVLKDSTLARYGARGIDFWTTLATADSVPATPTSSGDGVHFNNAGHRIFFERVLASPLLDAAASTVDDATKPADGLQLRALPNPAPATTIEVEGTGGPTRLDVFDLLGRHVRCLADAHVAAGTHRFALDGLEPGAYLVRLAQAKGVRLLTVIVVR